MTGMCNGMLSLCFASAHEQGSRGDHAAVINNHGTQSLKDKMCRYFLPHALQPPPLLCREKLCSIFNQPLT